MRRHLAMYLAVVAIASGAAALVPAGATADQAVECDGDYPVYETLSQTEVENEARIECVAERRRPVQDRIEYRRGNRAEVRREIRRLEAREAAITGRIRADRRELSLLTQVYRLLTFVRGDVTWAWTTAWCETGGTMDPTIHSPTGKYHGLGQFDRDTALEASWFHGADPHTLPAIVQGAGMVEVKRETSDERWPRCGD